MKDAEGSHIIVPDNNLVGKTNEWTHYFTKAGDYETYLDALYGAPTLTADDEALMSHYQKYCLAKKADESPIAIWSHDPNLVVLVSDDDEQGKPERYLLHVERSRTIK